MFRIDRAQVQVHSPQCIQANAEHPAHVNSTEQEEAARRTAAAEAALRAAEGEAEKAARARMAQAERAAEEIIKNATIEGNLKVQTAELEALEIRSNAWQAGYTEGKAAVQQELLRLRAEDQQTVEQTLDALARAREEMVGRFERDILELCFAMVKKIINVSIEKDDTIFESMLKKALQQMKWEEEITIRVNAKEYQALFPSGSATFVVGDKSVKAIIVDDPSVGPGGCIVESEGETINAGVDSQLKYLRMALEQAEGV